MSKTRRIISTSILTLRTTGSLDGSQFRRRSAGCCGKRFSMPIAGPDRAARSVRLAGRLQTINLLTQLPAATNPVILSLDANQNVTVVLSTANAWANNSSLTLTGAGSLILRGGLDGTGYLTVNAGSHLTANHIVQNSLVIGGTAESSATLVIAASDASGNPLASATTATSNSALIVAANSAAAPSDGSVGTAASGRLAPLPAGRRAQNRSAQTTTQIGVGEVSVAAEALMASASIAPTSVTTPSVTTAISVSDPLGAVCHRGADRLGTTNHRDRPSGQPDKRPVVRIAENDGGARVAARRRRTSPTAVCGGA